MAEVATAGEEAPAKENGEVKREENVASSSKEGDAMEVDEEETPTEKPQEAANSESAQNKTESSANNRGGASHHEHKDAQPGVTSGLDEQAPAKPHPESDMLDEHEGSGARSVPDSSVSLSHVPGPLTPAFLLQLIKLLRRKEVLLEKARQHNDTLQELKQDPEDGGEKTAEVSEEEKTKRIPVVQREYAWCVVQVDRTNFQLRNALWGVALGMYGSSSSAGIGASLQAASHAADVGGGKGAMGDGSDAEPILKRRWHGRRQRHRVWLRACPAAGGALPVAAPAPAALRGVHGGRGGAGGLGSAASKSRLEWDAAFDKVLADIRPAAADNQHLYQEIVLCVETLRQSVEA